MRCDVCGQELANSEEMKAHQERVHPLDDGDGEAPDLLDRPDAGDDVPEPAEPRHR